MAWSRAFQKCIIFHFLDKFCLQHFTILQQENDVLIFPATVNSILFVIIFTLRSQSTPFCLPPPFLMFNGFSCLCLVSIFNPSHAEKSVISEPGSWWAGRPAHGAWGRMRTQGGAKQREKRQLKTSSLFVRFP